MILFISHFEISNRTFQLLDHGFSGTMVGQILLGTDPSAVSSLSCFHGCIYGVLETGSSMTVR